MENIISAYRKLVYLLEEEYAHIAVCLSDRLLYLYREILDEEKEALEKMLRTLY